MALTIGALLVAVALPGWRDRRLQAQRSDGVTALMRVQAEQERYRAVHGLYAATLPELAGAGAPRSPDGRYRLALDRTSAEAYAASASAEGEQAADRDCPVLTLHVTQGFAVHGPSARCWNR